MNGGPAEFEILGRTSALVDPLGPFTLGARAATSSWGCAWRRSTRTPVASHPAGGSARRRAQEAQARLFDGIHGTLNHLMVGDRIRLARFSGDEAPSTNLDAILYEDFGELREARGDEDAGIEAFVAGPHEKFLRADKLSGRYDRASFGAL
ncbi:MAG TPA: hypothetical protein VE225_03020 [Rubrobacteraceae bacterium]|nr:hypothetical protein [Rubrobacteraceae bacterium]